MKPLKDQRGVAFVLELLVLALVIGLIVFVFYKALTAQRKNVKDTSSVPAATEKKEPKSVSISESTFTLTLPAGWKKGHENGPPPGPGFSRQCNAVPNAEVPEYNYCYEDSSGNYFDILVDPGGREIGNDIVWTLSPTATGFKIASEGNMCTPGDFTCFAGDNRFQIYMPGGKLNGHDYFFEAGNLNRETAVDTQVYKDILASFKTK